MKQSFYLLGHILADLPRDIDTDSFGNFNVGVHAVFPGNFGALGNVGCVGNLIGNLGAGGNADVAALGGVTVAGLAFVEAVTNTVTNSVTNSVTVLSADLKQ